MSIATAKATINEQIKNNARVMITLLQARYDAETSKERRNIQKEMDSLQIEQDRLSSEVKELDKKLFA